MYRKRDKIIQRKKETIERQIDRQTKNVSNECDRHRQLKMWMFQERKKVRKKDRKTKKCGTTGCFKHHFKSNYLYFLRTKLFIFRLNLVSIKM
jgi:hypothetical protein